MMMVRRDVGETHTCGAGTLMMTTGGCAGDETMHRND
jgi:hypothetical protein